jgi:hypothetical protein
MVSDGLRFGFDLGLGLVFDLGLGLAIFIDDLYYQSINAFTIIS